ncbi:hypothetical protein C7I55_10140 [Sphingomonas deserti]|uniref:Uncharacterized protein n=2 Tax=Allosphingosinicella deserti TaxID=2116704 RepID=A0A2P7QRS0_9SPHN|nr:hypothetical protein C7I55_10140 [Sphingomonas deserti]
MTMIFVIPFWKLFRRAGRSGWWALAGFAFPFGWFILPWLLLGLSRKRPTTPQDLGEVFS